ncbi:hypothetical protein A3I50_05255 [Candidatus Roizmanbacteria bacterium RIFCSPLOWO2_02_FULL_37_9]|nr:MAG: hypothetical protein A3I50_05255 [Candidatus Roizmanbacteria bacterium RIFCSPLOWO2_02_FULL_37_9]
MAVSDYDFKKIFLVFAGLFVFILAVVGTITSVYFYKKYQTAEKKFKEANLISQYDVRALVAKVGKLIKLPSGELPTIATITDLEKIKQEPFFAKAKVGDKVLLYMQAKKAFLYDPVNNLIVEVGPLTLPSGIPTPTPSTESSDTLRQEDIQGTQTQNSETSYKVAVYNGTSVASTLDNFLDQLESNYPNLILVQKANASKRTYSQTILVSLAQNNESFSQSLAEQIGAEISSLPEGEQAPAGADFLIILGEDRLKEIE